MPSTQSELQVIALAFESYTEKLVVNKCVLWYPEHKQGHCKTAGG